MASILLFHHRLSDLMPSMAHQKEIIFKNQVTVGILTENTASCY
jgi:hypothetical protein